MPHGYCFRWTPAILEMHVASDLVIGLAYVLIPVGLYRLHRRRPDLDFGWLFIFFSIFIVTCGLTHWFAVWNIWHADYWTEGIVKVVTALASLPTALLLWRALPKIIALPSHEAMARANSDLEGANRELRAFTETAAHDLRSPLAAVRLMLAKVARVAGPDLSDDARWPLRRVTEEIERMSGVVEARLRLAALAREPMVPAAVDLSAIADRIATRLALADPAAHVTVTVEPVLVVWGDAALLDVLIDNLLSNAWKFTAGREARTIRVERRVFGGAERICVTDDGVGFDMARAGELFKPLARLHDPAQFPGHGIGLATAARIVERHGGGIGIESAPGRGTTVWFWLPKPAGGGAARADRADG